MNTFVRSLCTATLVVLGSLLATPSYLQAATVAADAAADTALSEKVKMQIDNEPSLKDSGITVTARDGIVTLKGSVASPVVRVKAVEVARATEGVTKVVNKIAIAKQK